MIKQYDEETLNKLKKAELNILKDFIAVCEKHNLKYFICWGTAIGAVRHKGFIPWDDDIDVGMLRDDYEKFVRIAKREMSDHYYVTTPKTMKNYASGVIKVQRLGTKFVPEFSRTMKCSLCLHIDIFVFDNADEDEKILKDKINKVRNISKILFLCGSPYPEIPFKGVKGTAAKSICFMAHYAFKWTHLSISRLYDKMEKISKSSNYKDTESVICYNCLKPMQSKMRREDLFPLSEMEFEGIKVYVPGNYHKYLTNYYGDYMSLPPEEQRVNHAAYIVDFGKDGIEL
ncbi:MAG: LicD family protein [Lachnospiraceae bacterium]|nr:LicD family protein [Lachnospiraceae bacterium]MDE6234058.1 LicD family protein [Lachnospiraceae bacterium]MDE6252450.1 LicD family protein [Lachnospiraceae bacterium]